MEVDGMVIPWKTPGVPSFHPFRPTGCHPFIHAASTAVGSQTAPPRREAAVREVDRHTAAADALPGPVETTTGRKRRDFGGNG